MDKIKSREKQKKQVKAKKQRTFDHQIKTLKGKQKAAEPPKKKPSKSSESSKKVRFSLESNQERVF